MADTVEVVPHAGWDKRVLLCRCAPTVDVFAVVTERYVVLIDTLINVETGLALLEIVRPYLGTRQLLVVNTHSHWDHTWGNQVFAGPEAIYPAPILATRACAELFNAPRAAQKLAEMQRHQPERFQEVQLTRPTVLFEERLRIDGGDLALDLLLVPGHAHDQVAVFIPEISTLLAADAAEAPFPFAQSPETLPQLRASLAQMVSLNPQTVLYCHAPETAGPGLLRANIAYFDELERRCREALRRGVPAAPPEDADLEALVGFPFTEAIPAGLPCDQPDFYRPGHQAHLRMMLDWLAV
jgi:glyoxylase-like metal-dependent hydrolase (beta-lactamase superfamily II)